MLRAESSMTVEYCMARGFESKDVEYQQVEAERPITLRRTLTPDERERAAKRATLQLALTRAQADLQAARAPAHERMLRSAIDALELELTRDRDDAT